MRNIFFNRPDLYPSGHNNKTSDFHPRHVVFTKNRTAKKFLFLTGLTGFTRKAGMLISCMHFVSALTQH